MAGKNNTEASSAKKANKKASSTRTANARKLTTKKSITNTGNTKTVRTFKDSVFCDLFYSDRDAKKNILSLCGALHGTHYADESIVELVRLENVLFQGIKNDVAFLLGNRRIVLGEQQSTPNGNMPLRALMYIAREYERIVSPRDRYKAKRVALPWPDFYMFYNGTESLPQESVMRLSDAFPKCGDAPNLELAVHLYNINAGAGGDLLGKCQVIREYSLFVDEVRRQVASGNPRAMEDAVRICIKNGILSDYLQRKDSEVVSMLMAEYNYDLDMEVKCEEAMETGMEKGMEKGMELGMEKGMELGMEKGMLQSIRNLMETMGITADQAMDALRVPKDAQPKYASRLLV